MANALSIVDEKIANVKNNLILKDYDLFKESLSSLNLNNIIYDLIDLDNEDINLGINHLYNNVPLFSEADKLSFYVHQRFSNDSFSNKLKPEELEFLIEMLLTNEDIDISEYEDILKLNYSYKYKAKIDKLLERKNKSKIKVTHKKNNLEFIYKLLLSIMNNNVRNYYSFDSKLYFKNLARQDKVIEFLSSIGYKDKTDLLKEAYKNNDYRELYNLSSTFNLKNKDLNDLINCALSEEEVTRDINKINFIKEGNTSFKEFVSSNEISSDLLKKAFTIVDSYLGEDIARNNLNFVSVLDNTRHLELLLLQLSDLFKGYGFNIDINYIKGDIKDLDFIKEIFILKTLYYLRLLMNEKNIDLKALDSKEDLFKLLEGAFKEDDLAASLLPDSVTKLDFYNILLFLSGSKELKDIPYKEIFDKELENIDLPKNYTFKERFEKLSEDPTLDEKVNKFSKYFDSVKQLKYLTNQEIEVEISRQLYNMYMIFILSQYEVESDLNSVIDMIKNLKDTLKEETINTLEHITKEHMGKESETEKNIEVTNKAIEIIKEYQEKSEYINDSIEKLLKTKAEYDEYKDYIFGSDVIEKNIQDSIDKLYLENMKIQEEQQKLIEQEERKGIKIDLDEFSSKKLVKDDDFDDFLVFNHLEKEVEK